MSWTIEQWVAVATIVATTLTWAIAGVSRAWTYSREQNQREWLRLGEILRVLHNKNHDHGHWAQLAAVNELRSLKSKRVEILRISRLARAFWATGEHSEIVAELDLLISDLSKPRRACARRPASQAGLS